MWTRVGKEMDFFSLLPHIDYALVRHTSYSGGSTYLHISHLAHHPIRPSPPLTRYTPDLSPLSTG